MDVHAREGQWWHPDGRPGKGELVLEQIGPPLKASRQGRVILCGYVAEDGLPARRWRVVEVADAG